jgi:hypothetical protein
MIVNLTEKLRDAVKKATENNQTNLYYCILLHEAANEIERLQKKVVKADVKKADVKIETVTRSNLFKISKPASLSLAGSCLSNMEGR